MHPTLCFAALVFAFSLRAAAPLHTVLALEKENRIPEARAALEKILAAEPNHAAACNELGTILRERIDPPQWEEAVAWLAKAVKLEPENAGYLADFGGASLELADRTRSPSAAARGRDALEKSLAIAPENLDAREGLYQFYMQA